MINYNSDWIPITLIILICCFFIFLYSYKTYRVKESFIALLNKNDYFILADLIKTLDKQMISLREPWFLCCGNVLGYCRHGGTIPWDDDFDVCVSQKAYDALTGDLTEELDKLGYEVKIIRDGLAKLYHKERGKAVVYGDRVTRFPFIDIFAYTIAKDNGPILRDNHGNVCSPNDVHMSRATIPRCMPNDMIFPIQRVNYNVPHYGIMKLPIPNKPGDMIGKLYGPGALIDCVGRYYNHDLETSLPYGGQIIKCEELAKTMGIKLEINCTIPGGNQLDDIIDDNNDEDDV